MKKLLGIFLLGLLFTSCAANSKVIYDSLSNNPNYITVREAGKKKAEESIAFGEETKFAITKSDGIVIDDGIYSNHKMFSFEVDSKQNIQIQIRTLCDCFGIEKYILVPKLFLFDRSGKRIELVLSDRNYLGPELFLPASILYHYDVKLSIPGEYNLLICADNTSVGQVDEKAMGQIVMPAGKYIFIPVWHEFNLTSYPYGKLILKLFK